MTDAELLAIILRVGRGTFKTGVQGETALSLSRKLLVRYRGLKGLDRAEISEMLKVEGVSVAKVAQIKAALELGKRTQSLSNKPRQFETAAEVFRFIEPRFGGARNEIAVALYLDGQNHLLEDRVIAEGIPTQSTIYIRRVLEGALAASASGVVLIHNHPSGNLNLRRMMIRRHLNWEKGLGCWAWSSSIISSLETGSITAIPSPVVFSTMNKI